MRNLSRRGPANPCWPYQPAEARTAAGSRYPRAPRPGPPVPPVPSALVGRAVLSWLAPTLPRNRYKILPAQLLGGENGIKLSLHAEKAPNRAISGELGEFCTGYAARVGVRGEFCTGHAARTGVRGEFCTGYAARTGVQGEFCTGSGAVRLVLGEFCTGYAARTGEQGEFCTQGARRGCCWANNVLLWRSARASCWAQRPGTAHGQCGRVLRVLAFSAPAMGVLHYTKPSYGVSPACRTLV